MFNSIIKWFRRFFFSVAATPVMNMKEQEVIEPIVLPPQEEVVEVKFFQRANNLLAEFVGEEPRIYSSNFDDHDDPKKMYGRSEVEKEELLADDIEFLKNKPGYIKAPEFKETNVHYKSGIETQINND